MKHVRSDLGKGFEHEAPLVHGGMRDCEAGIVDDQVAEQQNVEIDDARTLLLSSLAAQLLLDFENAGEQLLRRLLGIQSNRTIQEPGLRGKFHRFGFVARRDRDDLAESPQAIDRRAQITRAITDIGAERKIDRFRHAISFQKKSRSPGIKIKTCGRLSSPARLGVAAYENRIFIGTLLQFNIVIPSAAFWREESAFFAVPDNSRFLATLGMTTR
jgi:hypothetical protein